MYITVQTIIDRVRTLLVDRQPLRWNDAQLRQFMVDGLNELSVYKPELFAFTDTITLEPGTRQALPELAVRLLEVHANGQGQPVVKANKEYLDAAQPTWHDGSDASLYPVAYIYNDVLPNEFWVYPAAAPDAQLTISYQVEPPQELEAEDDFELDAPYSAFLVRYVAAQALMIHAESGDSPKAQDYMRSWSQMLQASEAAKPSIPERNVGHSSPAVR
jgi:hypothetical protein